MRLRGNEKYYPEKIESKEFSSIMMILDPYPKKILKEKKHVSNKIIKKFKNL
jgi:hypothetical protein